MIKLQKVKPVKTATQHLHLVIQVYSLRGGLEGKEMPLKMLIRLVAKLKAVEHFQNTNGGLAFLCFFVPVAFAMTSLSLFDKRQRYTVIEVALHAVFSLKGSAVCVILTRYCQGNDLESLYNSEEILFEGGTYFFRPAFCLKICNMYYLRNIHYGIFYKLSPSDSPY